MPLVRRLPKRGFCSPFPLRYAVVNVQSLNRFPAGAEVGEAELRAAGLVKGRAPVKILGQGALDRALTVRAQKFSAQARQKIEAAGGKAETI